MSEFDHDHDHDDQARLGSHPPSGARMHDLGRYRCALDYFRRRAPFARTCGFRARSRAQPA